MEVNHDRRIQRKKTLKLLIVKFCSAHLLPFFIALRFPDLGTKPTCGADLQSQGKLAQYEQSTFSISNSLAKQEMHSIYITVAEFATNY